MKFSAVIPIKTSASPLDELIKDSQGKCLLIRCIENLQQDDRIGELVVTTDSQDVVDTLKELDFVKIHIRTEEKEKSNFGVVAKNVAKDCKYDTLVWSFATEEAVNNFKVDVAIDTYLAMDHSIYDSLVTCRIVRKYIFDENGPINFRTGLAHKESQNLPCLYQVVNNCFIMEKDLTEKLCYPWGKVPLRFIV